MTETQPYRPSHTDDATDDQRFGLAQDFVDEVRAALEDEHQDRLLELVSPLHYADAADLIEQLKASDREDLIRHMRGGFNPEILLELDEAVRDEIIDVLGYRDLTAAILELDSDDAVYLVDQLDEDERRLVLDALPAHDRKVIEQGLSFPEWSAGRLMQRELVAVPSYWTVGETIDYLRSNARLPDEFFVLFVVDARHRPIGVVMLHALLRTRRPVRLRDIMREKIHPVTVDTQQEEVAFLFRQKNLLSAPVIDHSGRLVGRITVDDVVDVIDEEAEEDMLALGGVSDTDLYRAVLDTAKARFRWLLLNLGTAVLASYVIGMFEATLEKVVALAVLMPIVASMGGNAGTQTLTVAVRSLAMKELNADNAMRIVGKEMLVGVLNGLGFAVLTAGVAYVWFGQMQLGIVIAAAMVINMLVAALAGITIPLGLERFKVDPAVSSGVFLTTVTDVIGFFAFLGLAALIYL
jgi:magnesium transporter